MGHPLIDEFCRVAGVGNCQSHFFNRCQREFRDQIQPMLDERERLLIENDALKKRAEELEAAAARRQPAALRSRTAPEREGHLEPAR